MTPASLDVEGLARALRRTVAGTVRFDGGARSLYATDASNFRQFPLGVVEPRTIDDVVATHAVCAEFGAPITNRGGGTSLAGQATNRAVVVDSSRWLRAIGPVREEERRVTCEPGVVLDDLRAATERPHGLTWGPDPATHNRCTVGGMIGNNACGMRAYHYGKTVDNVERLEVLLHDGTRLWVGPTPPDELDRLLREPGRPGDIYRGLVAIRDRYGGLVRERFPDIPRRVSGYNLDELLPGGDFNVARALVGTEGTCVTVLRAELRLNPYLPGRALIVAGYRDLYAAGDAVGVLRGRAGAIAIEGLDAHLVGDFRDKDRHVPGAARLPDGDAWLVLEFGGGTDAEAEEHAREALATITTSGDVVEALVYTDAHDQRRVWEARESALGVTAHMDEHDRWPGWEDAAVPPERVGDYLRDLRRLMDEHGVTAATYGHFGDGCIHSRLDFDLTSRAGVATYRAFVEAAADLVVSYGGSFSGEHGDGQQRGELLARMFGDDLVTAFRAFKAVWDPDGLMNPGKVVDARPLDADLRLGANYRPWDPPVVFGYPDDGGSFAHAALRCVGVGTCRRDDGAGTMCPSYMVTHEEMHSTRGRARLLFEMLQPDSQLDGWRDESVREALDLCLSCKGCATDCPVGVDMATYKAEFLAHHYAGRLHPRVHYALGLIDVWSRLASLVPGLANAVMAAPGIGAALKAAAGVTTRRPAPRYAAATFRSQFTRRPRGASGGRDVVLFVDTFTDHFRPDIGWATVEVLEDAGFRVRLPDEAVCCGRPLYDHGFLDRAGRYLDRLVALLDPVASAGVPIVGVEPSCVAVLRDELVQMRPDDPAARRVAASTRLLSELLVESGYDFPRLERPAIVHGHCHHKGALGMAAEVQALDAIGLDWSELDAGCCGLAGSFGFEAGEKYDVSVAAGERKLLPAVRAVPDETVIVANGFSCQTQIAHLQDRRRALSLAEVLVLAKRTGPAGPRSDGPVERAIGEPPGSGWTWRDTAVVAAGAGALALAARRALRS